jgi:hypothetical protein
VANRYFTQFQWTLEKNPVKLFALVTFGASGAPTLNAAKSKGIKSITRTSAGLYVVTFGTVGQPAVTVDTYNDIFGVHHRFLLASGHPAAPNMFIVSQAVATAGTMTIQFDNAAGTAATDPASGEAVYLTFDLKNSTAQ